MKVTYLELNAFQHGFLACLLYFKIPLDDDTLKITRENLMKYACEPEHFEKLDPREFNGGDRHEGAETPYVCKNESG